LIIGLVQRPYGIYGMAVQALLLHIWDLRPHIAGIK
jgi:hypothetical protein